MQTLAAETPAKRRFNFCKSSNNSPHLAHTTVRVLVAPAKNASVCLGAMPVDGLDAAVRKIGTSARPAGGTSITLHHVPATRKCRRGLQLADADLPLALTNARCCKWQTLRAPRHHAGRC